MAVKVRIPTPLQKLTKDQAEVSLKAQNVKELLEMKKMDFGKLIDKIAPKEIIGLSVKGAASSYGKLAKTISKDSCIVVGGFPKGHFSDQKVKKINNLVSVDKNPLEAHVIISRVLYEYEKELLCS